MRIPFIAGNWKMNKTIREAVELANTLKENLKDVAGREIVICPPYTALIAVAEVIRDSNIKLGAQDVHWEDKGAYTGEVSPLMLLDVGCKYVIIGHSERRQHLKESDEMINKKIISALRNGLNPILCIGETLEEREAGKTFEVVKNQLERDVDNIDISQIPKIIIAYEPVWAIGTGKTATPQQAEEVHSFLRKLISERFSSLIADETRIIYGGSITPENFSGIMAMKNVDGGLVGGASLNAISFVNIVRYK